MENRELSSANAHKILHDFGIIYNSKTNLSQLVGLKVLIELLKRGKFRERLTAHFGPYKARSILQMLLGLWAGGGPEQKGCSFASYLSVTKSGTKFREIFKRTRLDNGGSLGLGEIAGYRYDCLAANDFLVEESEAFEIYNKRAPI